MSRISPLQDLVGMAGAPLALTERAFWGHLNLRGSAADGVFAATAQAVLGMALPTVPNTTAQSDAARVLWLAPDEWLVQCAPDRVAPLHAALRTALAGQHAALTDVSDGHTVIVLEHPLSADLLARGCPLDLHPAVFAVGACAQSLLGKAAVVVVREAPERYAITVRRSFAPYVFHALQDAGRLALS